MACSPASSWTETSQGRRFTLVTYGIVLILLCLPVFSVLVPPLTDYPNHLARMHILASFADSPALQANYVIAWQPVPYLAMDLIVPPLARLMSIYMAGRIFLCAILCLIVLGTAAVNAALFGRLSVWPAGSALFAYNAVFGLGFTNYLFGVGVGLMAFAGWIMLSRRSMRWRIGVGSVLSLLVFFCHFLAFFGYGLAVAGYELGVWLAGRDRTFRSALDRLLAAGGTGIVPVAIFLYDLRAENQRFAGYGTVSQKLAAWLSPFVFPDAAWSQLIRLFSLSILIGGLLLHRVRLTPAMQAPLVVLLAGLFAMPTWLSSAWAVDYRLPVTFLFVLIASWDWKPASARIVVPLTCGMVALLAANMVSIVHAWGPTGAQIEAFRGALRAMAPGARVIAFYNSTDPDRALSETPLRIWIHMPALAVIERDAYLPYLFKNWTDPVQAAPALKVIDTPQGFPVSLSDLLQGADPTDGPAMLGRTDAVGFRNYWGDWPRHFDYAIQLRFGTETKLPPQLELLRSGEAFGIYRVQR